MSRSVVPGRQLSFIAALFVAALSFRAPIVAIAPVTDPLSESWQVDAAELGVLTALPLLAFGLAAPLALLVIRRWGPEASVLVCLGGVVAGSLIRVGGGFTTAVTGTAVIGVAITLGNVVVPVLVHDRVVPNRVAAVTGGYTAAMNVGSMTVTVLTAPLAAAWGWRLALASWSVVGVIGLITWLAVVPARRPVPRAPRFHERRVLPRANPLAWLLALAFAGQAGSYYGLAAWLPTLLVDRVGLSPTAATSTSGIFQILAMVGALGIPLLAPRGSGLPMVLVAGVAWVSCPAILLLAPDLYLAASLVGGVAQGAGFTAVLILVVRSSSDTTEAAGMSAMVQGLGYCLAAAPPIALGWLHGQTDGWGAPLLLVIGTTGTFMACCLAAVVLGRRRPKKEHDGRPEEPLATTATIGEVP